MKKSAIIWLTGLSGAGKSTLAALLEKKLKFKNYKVLRVDGDNFRKKTNLKNSFTKKNIIINNNNIISHISSKYLKYNYTIVSVISPLRETRKKALKVFKDNYNEIYVYCPIKELIKRDTKGLYLKAKKNIIKNLIGYNSKIKYEKSLHKIIKINTNKYNKNSAVKKILHHI